MLEILEKSHGKELAEHWPACVNGTPPPPCPVLPALWPSPPLADALTTA